MPDHSNVNTSGAAAHERSMRPVAVAAGGIVAGLIIIAGEAALNLLVLADDWAALFDRFALPRPTPAVAAQGMLKLLVLGVFSVWLAAVLKRSFPGSHRAGIAAGLCVWFLVWAWVQWGMLLAGYVTPTIAATTVLWGLIELPLATWLGTRTYCRKRPSGATSP